jgi:hypothetical protein
MQCRPIELNGDFSVECKISSSGLMVVLHYQLSALVLVNVIFFPKTVTAVTDEVRQAPCVNLIWQTFWH